MTVIVLVVGAADGTPTPHDGRYVVAWNPHVEFGTLAMDSTDDPAKARRFPDAAAVFAEWRAVSRVEPKRSDGRPNCPLAALTILTLPYSEESA